MNTWHLGVYSSRLWKVQAVSSFHTCPCTQAPQPALLTVFIWDPAVKDMLVSSLLWFHQQIVFVTLSDWPTPVLHAQWYNEEDRGPASEGSGTRHTQGRTLCHCGLLSFLTLPVTSAQVFVFHFGKAHKTLRGDWEQACVRIFFQFWKIRKRDFFFGFYKTRRSCFLTCALASLEATG